MMVITTTPFRNNGFSDEEASGLEAIAKSCKANPPHQIEDPLHVCLAPADGSFMYETTFSARNPHLETVFGKAKMNPGGHQNSPLSITQLVSVHPEREYLFPDFSSRAEKVHEIIGRRKEAIREHRWYASEKAGYDVTNLVAVPEWLKHYSAGFYREADNELRSAGMYPLVGFERGVALRARNDDIYLFVLKGDLVAEENLSQLPYLSEQSDKVLKQREPLREALSRFREAIPILTFSPAYRAA